MNELQILDKREILSQQVTTFGNLENPLFLAKDVATWIDHKDVTSMLRNIDEDEKIVRSISGGKVMYNFLTEDGLYEVLMLSRKPIAKQFKKEVKKILKQIRQTGGYIPHNDEDDDATIMAKALLISQKTIEKKNNKIKSLEKETLKLVEVIESQKPKLEYLDEILSSENAMTVTQIAFDYDLSAKALNKILNEERVQRNVRGQWILYSNYQGKGYTKTETENYGGKPRTLTVWTQKGRMLIHEILNKRQIKALMDLELSEV